MKIHLNILQLVLLSLISITILFSYQNCAKSGNSGNGQPYGGLRSFYHVNEVASASNKNLKFTTNLSATSNLNTMTDLNTMTNLNSTSNLNPNLNQNSNSNSSLNAPCWLDSRIDLINETYYLFNDICSAPASSTSGQVISSNNIKPVNTLPLLSYNSGLWQEATSQDLTTPSFLWYLNACSSAQGFYFDMQSPDLSSSFANVQVLKFNKDLGNTQSDIVKVAIKKESLNFAVVNYEFDSVIRKDTTVDLGSGFSERTIERTGTSSQSNSTLLFRTVQKIMMGQPGLSQSYLLMNELNPNSGAQPKVYFDGDLFCM